MTDNPNANAWKDPAIWGRAVFALLYMLILVLVVGPLVIVLGLAQGVFTIATGEDNRNLRDLGVALAGYVHEMLLFVTWNREQKPFPFNEFPRVEGGSAGEEDKFDAAGDGAPESGDAEEEVSTEAAETGKPAKKSARKKKSGSSNASANDSASQA